MAQNDIIWVLGDDKELHILILSSISWKTKQLAHRHLVLWILTKGPFQRSEHRLYGAIPQSHPHLLLKR